jgi:hypothetical protein
MKYKTNIFMLVIFSKYICDLRICVTVDCIENMTTFELIRISCINNDNLLKTSTLRIFNKLKKRIWIKGCVWSLKTRARDARGWARTFEYFIESLWEWKRNQWHWTWSYHEMKMETNEIFSLVSEQIINLQNFYSFSKI